MTLLEQLDAKYQPLIEAKFAEFVVAERALQFIKDEYEEKKKAVIDYEQAVADRERVLALSDNPPEI